MHEPGAPLPVVIIHLGTPYPPHLQACVSQVRAVAHHSPFVVGHALAAGYRTDALKRFRRAEGLSGLGGAGFWRWACERLFVLDEFMARAGIDRCVHIETDVLLYCAPTDIEGWLDATYGGDVAVCPMTDTEDTAAFMYVGSRAALTTLCGKLLELVSLEPDTFRERYGDGMAHEMRMLHILRVDEGLCRSLPTTVDQAKLTGAAYLFDPASYGQWVDGIPGYQGTPYAGEHHLVGRELIAGNCELVWDAQVRKPTIRTLADATVEWPLANLHLHSKRLELFSAHRTMAGVAAAQG